MTKGSFIITGGSQKSRELHLAFLLASDNLPKQLLEEQQISKKHLNSGSELNPNDPDILVIKPEEGGIAIGISEIRKIQTNLSTKPVTRKEKIVVVFDAQLLTIEAQNAFLKTLEEPPENSYLFLLTSNPELLLSTIQSRCQQISLPPEEFEPKKLIEIDDWDLGKKWQLAASWSKSRQEATSHLEETLVAIHQKIRKENVNKIWVNRSKDVYLSLNALRSNSSVRLVIENLFLNW